jgi:hypothetical protein
MLWEADSVSWFEKLMVVVDAETDVKTVLFSGEEQDDNRKRIQKKPGMTAFGIYGNFCEAKADGGKMNIQEHYFPRFQLNSFLDKCR